MVDGGWRMADGSKKLYREEDNSKDENPLARKEMRQERHTASSSE
jgi:hypothetical protein